MAVNDDGISVWTSIDLPLEPAAAFKTVVEELQLALVQSGMRLEAGPHGRIMQGEFEVGRVTGWESGKHITLDWRQASWQGDEVTNFDILFTPTGGGTQVKFGQRHWGRLIGDGSETAGWFVSAIAAPFMQATSPEGLGDWITDRRARRPSGAQFRAVYADPLFHYPNFRVILDELGLAANDYLLEVGCGGGALLKDALKSGCKAAAVDHSADMVRLALQTNRDAVETGRLVILEAGADRLPFANETFTCATMTGVLGFLADPVEAFRELWRVLQKRGRFVGLGSEPSLRGTPAAPEPMASRLQFYEDDELEDLARRAGFSTVKVVRRVLEQYAREVGVPEEHLPLFAGAGTPFLIAGKD
jgi:ubiquinone/menaquinone biosynthesis C-methylase UbiE